MTKQASLLNRLESTVGREGVLADVAAFAVDGLTPQAAVAPASYEQTAEVMRYAHAEGLAVIPWGGGAHMHTGNVPCRYDIALSLSRLNAVVEHEPADLTATVQAGIPLGELQRHLGGANQLLPLDPPGGERATIGGILAANAWGPWRHAFGTARDMTIGLRVVTAEGRITRAGGRVVKNVAGYDLCKLYIGSLGTLGIIVEATFKLAPMPQAVATVATACESAAEACGLASALQRRGLAVRAISLMNRPEASGGSRYAFAVELAGTPAAVDRSRREVAGLTPLEALAKMPAHQPGDSDSLLCKASVLPSRLPALIHSLEALEAPRLLAYPAVGVCYAAWASPLDAESIAGAVRELTSAAGGTLVLERCPLDLKRRTDVFGEPPASFELMRRIKEQFDPRGVLSPGRFVGRL
ncbi:MAG: FAD-binding oxidoreductase [Dehalococcoidia bacterium]|nr:FAD-binding oxidoreductase [Dehalococcoidia bacterium]